MLLITAAAHSFWQTRLVNKMEITGTNVCMTREELDQIIESNRFRVNEHTPHYLNGIFAEYGGFSIGFHCWLDNLECWIGSTDENSTEANRIHVKDEKHLELILNAMDSLMALRKYEEKSK